MPGSEQHRNTCCPWLKIPHKEQEMNTSWVTSSGDGLGLGTCTWTSKVTDLSLCLGCPNLVSGRQAGKAGHPPDHLGPTGATQEEEADGGELPQRAEPSPPTSPCPAPALRTHIR